MKKGLKLLLLSLLFTIMPIKMTSAQDKTQVLTTIYPIYFLTEYIAGDAMDVSLLLDSNQDAHSYEPSANDVLDVQAADLFIYQDDEMEFFVSDLLSVIDTESTQIVESTEGIELLTGAGHDHDHEEDGHEEDDHDHSHDYDPHTWLDPLVYAQQAENIKQALIEIDPDNAALYEENAASLVAELEVLDQEYQEALAELTNRTFVVQHAAFGYLAHAYDLEQVAITGISTTAEPGAKQLAQMQDFVTENEVQVIYVEPSLSKNVADTIAAATGAQLRPLRTLEAMTQEEIDQGMDYFTIMRENLEQLVQQ